MVFEKVKKDSLVANIVRQMEQTIVGGAYSAGDKLPSVQNLQETLGASHGTLREALRVLQQKGLVEIRLGVKGGAYVKDSGTDTVTESLALLMRQRKVSVQELAEFREVVEVGLVRLAAEKATPKDVEQLKKYLLEFQKHLDRGEKGWSGFLEVEVRFRKALIRIAGNPMYEAVLVPIHSNLITYTANLPFERVDVKDAYSDYRQLLDAMAQGDVERAASIMHAHISFYADVLTQENGGQALRQSPGVGAK